MDCIEMQVLSGRVGGDELGARHGGVENCSKAGFSADWLSKKGEASPSFELPNEALPASRITDQNRHLRA
jgi:hypothetical protein